MVIMDVSVLTPFLDAHKETVQQYNTVAGRLAAVEGDRDKAIQAWMDSSNDETAVRLREAVAEATRRLKLLAEQNIVTEDISEAEKEKLRTERDTYKEKLLAGSRTIVKLVDAYEIEDVDAKDLLKELGDPFVRKTNDGGGGGSGLPRASVNVHIANSNSEWGCDSLSKAASIMDIPVEELQKLYAQAGGVAHEDIKTIKEPTQFEWTSAKGVEWKISTTPKETAPRGRKAVTPKDPNELPAA